jgi:hypothetical protein
MNLASIWIFINIIFYIGVGVFTLFKPEALAASLSLQFSSPAGLAELKSSYGGLMIILSVSMWILYAKQPLYYPLGFITLLYIGFGLGRLVGILGNQVFDKTTLTYSAIEIVCFAISVLLYAKHKV